MPRLTPPSSPVTIELDGEQLEAMPGEPVACALLAHDEWIFSRSPKYHRPRGPFCFSGACAQCLMQVDGVPNVPSCRVAVHAGMRLERQNALPDARLDVLRGADFVFRSWFNHHEFLAGWPLADQVLLKIARKLSGLGVVPVQAAPAREPAVIERHSVVVVGAGAAGLSAAKALTEQGVEHVLLEREPQAGGRLLIGAEFGQGAPWAAPARVGAEVVALFCDDGAPFLAVVHQQRLHLIFFEWLLLAVGSYPTLPTFPNNDVPGVMAGRAVSRLIRKHQLLPGQKIACVGEEHEAQALAKLIQSAGGEAVAVGKTVRRVHGLRRVDAVTLESGEKVSCDVVAVCEPQSPATELARATGAHVCWLESAHTFAVQTSVDGRTANARVFVAGEMRGPMSSAAAAEQGLAAASALAFALKRGAP